MVPRTIALFRPGGGLLARMNRATLFIERDLESPAAADLIGAFRATAGSERPSVAIVRAMARVVAQHEFESVPPFTCVVGDTDQIHAIVYGNLTVHVRTDLHSEVLDASYAVTWVDRRIEGTLIDVSVGDVPDANRAWFVSEGVVPASGALVCFTDATAAGADAVADEPVPAAAVVLADARPEPAPVAEATLSTGTAPVVALGADQAPEHAASIREAAAAFEPAPAPEPATASALAEVVALVEAAPAFAQPSDAQPSDAEPSDAEPSDAELADAPTATVIDMRDHRSPAELLVPEPAGLLEPSSSVLPPPPPPPPYTGADIDLEVETEESARTLTLVGPEVRTVAGLQCQSGHLNRPDALRCSQCTAPLDRSAGTVIGPRPSLGTLNFEHTGAVVALTHPVVVGSAPPEDLVIAGEGAAFVLVHGEGVSGTQFEVHLDNWDAYVIDRSVTGTYLDDTSGRRHRLPRHARVKIKVGSAIVFGDHRVRIDAPEG